MNDVDYERPVLRCLVATRWRDDLWGEPFVVTLETAAELSKRGDVVLIDPQDERDLAMWEIAQRSLSGANRKWFMPRD